MWWCKCDLKTEALFIAVFYTVGSGISVLSHLILIASSPRISIKDAEPNEESVGYATANALAISVVSSVINGLLLYGVMKENRFTIIPWLVLHAVVLLGGALLLLFLPILFSLILVLLFGSIMCYSWYTIWKYFRYLDPHNPYRPPQTAVYATTGLTNQQFVSDKQLPPDTVVFTPGLPAYNDIEAQPQNV